ncbi:MAG: DUF1549 and DUF1553 domain-containing protein [Lacipirellulaceae bacterium]
MLRGARHRCRNSPLFCVVLVTFILLESRASFAAEHWAFVPPKKHEVPAVQNETWVANPIDDFILAKLESQGLTPAYRAKKQVLARRLYYDVIGLPPTPEQLRTFSNDDRPDAYERLVNDLLASPHYGEKWARHWLDVVRYGESNSFERDAPKPYVWKYRDYVIRAFNEDRPYDQFVLEQLAGDQLAPPTTESITATGFYRLGTWDDEPADPLQAKYDDLDNILSTTSQAFLGLTIGCARCHDHKIDPIPQTDYYGMLAFFADVTPYALPDNRDPKLYSLRNLATDSVGISRQAFELKRNVVRKAKRQFEQTAIKKLTSADQVRTEGKGRAKVLKEKLPQVLSANELAQYQTMVSELQRLNKQISKLPKPEWVLSLAETISDPPPTHVMLRGNPHALGEQVEPHYPDVFGEAPSGLVTALEVPAAPRRRILAEWITHPDNMLASRVIVNRVWQHHFGRGIVRSSNNYGYFGTEPTHPELLDWLACWLVDNRWSLKKLHRLILTSNTYRMAYVENPTAAAADPENDLFWRFDMRRLTAEEIRDSVLAVSGQLNLKMYGPSIYPKLSAEVRATQSRPGADWGESSPREQARRSIYIHIKRSLIPPELAAFDFPETDTSCETRFNTTQAAQALNLLHSEFLQAQSAHFAKRVTSDAGKDQAEQVAYAFRLALQREPDEQTIQDGLSLMARYQSQHGLSEQAALQQFCLMVLNLNEFVFLD